MQKRTALDGPRSGSIRSRRLWRHALGKTSPQNAQDEALEWTPSHAWQPPARNALGVGCGAKNVSTTCRWPALCPSFAGVPTRRTIGSGDVRRVARAATSERPFSILDGAVPISASCRSLCIGSRQLAITTATREPNGLPLRVAEMGQSAPGVYGIVANIGAPTGV